MQRRRKGVRLWRSRTFLLSLHSIREGAGRNFTLSRQFSGEAQHTNASKVCPLLQPHAPAFSLIIMHLHREYNIVVLGTGELLLHTRRTEQQNSLTTIPSQVAWENHVSQVCACVEFPFRLRASRSIPKAGIDTRPSAIRAECLDRKLRPHDRRLVPQDNRSRCTYSTSEVSGNI